ncbi:AMP-binding protein, partial [Nocardioides sp.]|uniref:AMP-binding protein n=1 Tax=Nocardioides sp. TaxID=35761 RepID=UPI003561D7AC
SSRRVAIIDLSRYGARPALVHGDRTTTYAELSQRVDEFAARVLGPTRRLVLIEGANHPDALVPYLAALNHGHVALLVPDDGEQHSREMLEAYNPDVVVRRRGDAWEPQIRRTGSAHELHPDLALLLSTSGSTGSAKLVRLSADNVRSNASSIAGFLRLSGADRAATSLPMHYCYGLSVINSHLSAGASLLLTERSVLEPCFWNEFDRARATSFAGVPHTFELLDHAGFGQRQHPSLRYVTQAGGRLAPDLVVKFATWGRQQGWDLVVMYGQTEATARIAYLPPALAAERPEAIGVPIPGGSLRVEPLRDRDAEDGVGELVYSGPNVMLGYAETAEDLALGRTVHELRTGDLGRVRDGLFEITGRTGRFAKVFGLRIDLDRIETLASTPRTPVWCVAEDETVHAFTTRARLVESVRGRVAQASGLPPRSIRVSVLDELPLTRTGKRNHAELTRQAQMVSNTPAAPGETASGAEEIRDEFVLVLGRPDATIESTFVGLGGDSLSYVELATRLSRRVSALPPQWHTMPIRELAATRSPGTGVQMDTTVLLRALAIFAIVGTHANLFTVVGGAHLLLAVAGYNFARFQVSDVPRRTRIRHAVAGTAQIVVPSTLFIGSLALITGFYDLKTAFLLNGLLGSDSWSVQWQFWFLEALVWTSLAAAALLAVPAIDTWERRAPFAVPALLVVITLVIRFVQVGVEAGATERYAVGTVAWCFFVGWLASRAATWTQRVAVIVASGIGVIGFFGDLHRELLVVAGVSILVCWPTARVPRRVASALGVVAASSLFVYLTHWQVYPHLEDDYPLLATLASFAVGIGYWM